MLLHFQSFDAWIPWIERLFLFNIGHFLDVQLSTIIHFLFESPKFGSQSKLSGSALSHLVQWILLQHLADIVQEAAKVIFGTAIGIRTTIYILICLKNIFGGVTLIISWFLCKDLGFGNSGLLCIIYMVSWRPTTICLDIGLAIFRAILTDVYGLHKFFFSKNK